MICKLKLALIVGLTNLLDSALFLSLIVQIAGILYGNVNTVVGDPSELTQDDKDNFSGALYDFRLVLYTSCITLCPVLTLFNTPYLRKSLGRRRFRLGVISVAVGCAGYINIVGNMVYLKAGPEYRKE
jgi:hypothetical protein